MIDFEPTQIIPATGAAATAVAAAPQVFAQQQGAPPMSFYEKGAVRIRYQEAGSGFPLLLISGGGLNSSIAGLARGPFDPIAEFKNEYRCIACDLRNSANGQSTGPLDADRPWDLRRRPARGDGSSRHQQIYGAGLLHRRSVRLEFAQARARPHRRRRAGAAERIAPGGARLFLREQHEDLGPRAGEAPARVHHGDGRQVPDQHDSAPTPTSCSPSRATSCATARPRC